MFIEVEKIESQDIIKREKQEKRVRFYKRHDAKRLDLEYYLPNKKGCRPMDLFYISFDKEPVLKADSIKNTVMSIFKYLNYFEYLTKSSKVSVGKFLTEIKDQNLLDLQK